MNHARVLAFSFAETGLRESLEARNRAILRRLAVLGRLIEDAAVPELLEPYRSYLRELCEECRAQVDENERRLALGVDELLDDLLSEVQQAADDLHLLGRQLLTPILRSTPSDRLCLKMISWMHGTDPATASMPAAFQDADVAVLPLLQRVPIYFFPALDQRGLLLQPLFFHEFGHLLYQLHEPEMNALVAELQGVIGDALQPPSHRDDAHARKQAERRGAVVNAWYLWTQELFCDAVGLVMAGPAFLYAFSSYCGNARRDEFCLPVEDLRRMDHPVTWLRVRLLVHRAHELGYHEAAETVRAEWARTARALKVDEDYFGFFEDEWLDAVSQTLGDLLTEAAPRLCLPAEALPTRDWQAGDTPIFLLNLAWRQQPGGRHANYAAWESAAIERFLSEDSPLPSS